MRLDEITEDDIEDIADSDLKCLAKEMGLAAKDVFLNPLKARELFDENQ